MARAEEPGANPGLSRNCDRGASPAATAAKTTTPAAEPDRGGRQGARRSGSQETPAIGWTNCGRGTREGRGWMMAGAASGTETRAGQARSAATIEAPPRCSPLTPERFAARRTALPPAAQPAYPFAAIVGMADLKLALLLNAVSPAIGGVLVRGEKGTAKSTVVRGLAALLPAGGRRRGLPVRLRPGRARPGLPGRPASEQPAWLAQTGPAGRAARRRHRGQAGRARWTSSAR